MSITRSALFAAVVATSTISASALAQVMPPEGSGSAESEAPSSSTDTSQPSSETQPGSDTMQQPSDTTQQPSDTTQPSSGGDTMYFLPYSEGEGTGSDTGSAMAPGAETGPSGPSETSGSTEGGPERSFGGSAIEGTDTGPTTPAPGEMNDTSGQTGGSSDAGSSETP